MSGKRCNSQQRKRPAIKLVKTLHEDESWVEYVEFSPCENFIATCSGNNASVWNVKLVTKETTFKHNDAVWKCVFSHDSYKLYTAASDGCLYVWDIDQCKSLLVVKLHMDCVFGVTIHPRLNIIATCSADYTIKCFNTDKEEITSTLKGHSMSVEDVSFSPCGNMLASCSKDKTILLWNNFQDEMNLKAYSLLGHKNWVYMCRFSPNGKILASVSSDKTVGIWSVENHSFLRLLHGHGNVVWGCSFISVLSNQEDTFLATCSSDKTIRIWQVEDGKNLYTQRYLGGITDGTAQLLSCAFAPLSRLLAVSTYHGNVYIGKMPDSVKTQSH